MTRLVKVLSIDGGGIRGIIPAIVLDAIEKRTGRSIASLFDLIAGTSTGAILALGLTRPDASGQPQYSAESLISLYETEGPVIFSRPLCRRLMALGNLADDKYPVSGIEKVLKQYLGNARLKDALTDLLITAYEIERRTPFFFRSCRAKLSPEYDFPMRLVARAASAAPTYFEPARINIPASNDYYALVDGGVFANNPAMCAYVEARTLHPQASDYLLVSLGTGSMTRPLPYHKARDWGLAGWAQPLLSVIFDGISDTVDYQLRHLLPPRADGSRLYYRFQVQLDKANDNMDDVRPENIRALRLLGEEIIETHSEEIDGLCKILLESGGTSVSGNG